MHWQINYHFTPHTNVLSLYLHRDNVKHGYNINHTWRYAVD